MSRVFEIFYRDLKRILRNPVALVVTLGVCVIPSLYAWFNIIANWDPYKNTQDVPVAVVNQDTGDAIEGMGDINAGDMVVERLKENDQLDWEFVDKQDALDGVTSGRYYAAIVLPETFTQDLASVLSGNLSSPTITYYVNEKLNPIAPKVTDTGANTLETQIDQTFVETASGVVLEKLQGLGSTTLDSLDSTTDNVVTKIENAQASANTLEQGLADTRDALMQARNAADSAGTTLETLSSQASGASQDLKSALDTINGVRQSKQELTSSLTADLTRASGLAVGASAKATSAVSSVSGAISQAQGTLEAALAQAQRLQDQNAATLERLERLTPLIPSTVRPQWDDLIARLQTQLDRYQEAIDTLEQASSDIKANNDATLSLATTLNNSVQSGADSLLSTQDALVNQALPALDGALDTLSGAGADLSGALGALSPALMQAQTILDQLDTTLADADSALALTQTQVQNVAADLGDIATDIKTVQASDTVAKIRQLTQDDPEDVAQFLATPVTIDEQSVFTVANYGSGVAPFYTNLALWVGGFVLVAIYKLEVDTEGVGSFSPWQGLLGRWLLLFVLGELQGLICTVGDLAIGIQCVNPALFIVAGLVESFVYVSIIYAFSVAFKHIGKALCVLLVILQIPGSAGTYPIEMMPGFYQNIHPWLPFTYGIDAMRETIAGSYGNYYLQNIGMLLLFMIPALIVGLGLRRPLINVNVLFDRRLSDTDLMISERFGTEIEHYRLAVLVRALSSTDESRKHLQERLDHFEQRYPKIQRGGFICLVILPIGLAIAMFASPQPAKLTLFILWIVSIVILDTVLIITEYIHDSLHRRINTSLMSRAQVVDLIDEGYAHEHPGNAEPEEDK
ncbi:MAG: YhgE/Pip family protein [Atopobiaceae bacterium]